MELKEDFKDVFQDVPGRTDVVTHDIPTGDARPVRLPPYRLAHKSQDFLREEIKTLLEQEIIEPSKSPWAAPIVLVTKKDGSTRMCVDYRKLNAITQADPYPLSRIEVLIDGIGQSIFITTWISRKDIIKYRWNKRAMTRQHLLRLLENTNSGLCHLV